jgi:sugar phosphate isomerase/epimerase
MARLAISQLTTFRWSFEEDVEHYQKLGISAIGVWRHKLTDVGEDKAALLLERAGLDVSSLQWAGGFTGSSGVSYEDSLADARQAILAAGKIGAPCLIVHSGARGVHTHNHARRLFHQALEKLLPLAEEHGVKLALEPMKSDCGGDFTFFNCLEETLNLINEHPSAALGITLDTYHWGHEPKLLESLPRLAPKLVLVQLGDARQPPCGEPNRCALGDGRIPLREIVERTLAAGYDGFFEVELVGEDMESADYRDVLRRTMRTFNDWASGDGAASLPYKAG